MKKCTALIRKKLNLQFTILTDICDNYIMIKKHQIDTLTMHQSGRHSKAHFQSTKPSLVKPIHTHTLLKLSFILSPSPQ